jgi:MFS family permease
MVTMPIAGALSDRIPVGRIVPFGLLLITGGMFALTQISATTPYPQLITILFIMGLVMGATMMPIMTSALRTLRASEVARGSTLLNIVQQIASSVGVAVMSVVLTNNLKSYPLAGPATASWHDPALAQQLGPAAIAKGLHDAGLAFAHTYWVAAILVALTFVPAAMLPRKHEESHLLDDVEGAPPVVVH